jgi:hypothetical protein
MKPIALTVYKLLLVIKHFCGWRHGGLESPSTGFWSNYELVGLYLLALLLFAAFRLARRDKTV